MKKLLVFTGLVIALFQGHTQNTDYYDRMAYVFGNIDKTKVTTGFLKEFGIRFNNVEAYDGILDTDNLVDQSQWQSLYTSLYTMRVGSVAQNMTAPNVVYDNLTNQQDTATEDVLLAALYYNYQQYKTNAVSNGDVTVSNDQIFDVVGRNPYDSKTVFGVTPLKQRVQGDVFTFKLPSGLIYTNTSLSLSQVQIDFGDGNGYQTITLNTAKTITYTSGGAKDITVKFVYSNGPTLYSQSKIWVDYIASGGGQTQARFNGFGTDVIFDEEPITGDPYQGSSATGLVTVELAPGHTELTKPLIVVEGFDPENTFDYNSLINQIGPGGLLVDIVPGAGFNTLNQAIEDEDYDLVFVDFADSTTHIQRNAYMVEAVIEWVNGLKQTAGSTEQNVVLGMSMGGLVARYALRHMETDNDPTTNHDTKLYISHDTPHQGANVPLAYQAFVRHLVGEEISLPVLFALIDINIVDLTDFAPELEEGLALLQTSAAQQMLTYQLQGTGDNVSVNNSTMQSSFLSEYSSMGYPQQNGIRNIAIANGSECGTPLDFANNATLVNIYEKIDLPYLITNIALAVVNGISINPSRFVTSLLSTDTDLKVEFSLRGLPDRKAKQIYSGKIYIEKKILFLVDVEEDLIDRETVYSTSSMLPLDNANGGVFNLEGFADLPAELDQYIIEREFNFIPAYSSLDIGGGTEIIGARDLNKTYSPLSPPIAPKDVPFDNFFTNPLISEQHIQFTLNNGNWLLTELQDSDAFYSCVSTCSNGLGLVMIGEDQICNSDSESYYVNNIRSGLPITWSVSPPGGFTLTSNGNSATLTPNGNFTGVATLTAAIDIDTECADVIVEKQIQSGSQRPIYYDENGNEQATFTFCMLDYDGISFNTPPGVVEWEWTNNNNFAMTASNNSAQFYSPTPDSGVVTVRSRDACGWSAPTFLVINLTDCSGGGGFGNFRMAQNPVNNGNLRVIENQNNTSGIASRQASSSKSSKSNTAQSRNANDPDITFEFYDLTGLMLATWTEQHDTQNWDYDFDVTQYDNGNYFIKIIFGDIVEIYQIIIDN